jgi:hypothetical protein
MPVSDILCLRCFARFSPREVYFQCPMHSPPRLFRPPRSWWGAPVQADCTQPRCRIRTGYRACPHCQQTLPLYAGRLPQRVVALTGCTLAGKTAYLWALIHQMWEQVARDPNPFAVAMFEDQASYQAYEKLDRAIVRDRVVPEMTRVESQKRDRVTPLIIRLLRPGRSRAVFNAAFYDPAGELVQSIEGTTYLHYLAHAEGLIYLLDARDGTEVEDRASLAAEGLSAVTIHLRQALGIRREQRLPHALAVVLTKADEDIFSRGGAPAWVAGMDRGQRFWRWWPNRALHAVSQRVQGMLRERGFDNLVSLARNNYRRSCFFAVSSFGQRPRGERLLEPALPVGVEGPLFWTLKQMS